MDTKRKTQSVQRRSARAVGWPRRLVEMQTVTHAVLSRGAIEPQRAGRLAWQVVGAIATALGGQHVYLPIARTVRLRARNEAILEDWNGRNTREIAERWGITTRAVEMIAAQERERLRGPDAAAPVPGTASPGEACPHLWALPDAAGASVCVWCAIPQAMAPPDPTEGAAQ